MDAIIKEFIIEFLTSYEILSPINKFFLHVVFSLVHILHVSSTFLPLYTTGVGNG